MKPMGLLVHKIGRTLAVEGRLSGSQTQLPIGSNGSAAPVPLIELMQCADLFCTYPAVAARAALARVTLARMSLALAVQMNGLGSML